MIKRLVCVAICIGAFASAALADDNIRAAQTKLKEDGFYFEQIDGAPSSDFSAAITRYQIRNGLQITGKLNGETSKALGVKAEAASNEGAAPTAETWRRLRNTDERFLERHASSQRAPQVPPRNDSPMNVLERTSRDSPRVVLSPERLRDYIAAFVLAGLDAHVGAELEFFGDRVKYYGEGVIGREKIRTDLQRYAAHWPERHFWLAGDPNVTPQPDNRLRVSFPVRYELRNGSKHSSGTIVKTLLLEVHGEELQIVGVNEHKA